MPKTLTKIPVTVLKHKEKENRFLALSVEHIDMSDPDGDVTLDNIIDAHVMHRKDFKQVTAEDIERIADESDRYIAMMKKEYGPNAIISYKFREWLETYEPYHIKVDAATFNRISFENEWDKYIGKLVAPVNEEDWVMLPPFDQEPTIQNVYVVQHVEHDYIAIEGMRGWLRIPKRECNFRIVDGKQIKYEFADNSSDKYVVTVSERLEQVALQFSTGWGQYESLKFAVNDIDFCISFIDYPTVTLSDARAGVKVKDFTVPIQLDKLDLLKKWILSDPLACIIDIWENKVSPEEFKAYVENAEKRGVEMHGPKPSACTSL